MLIAFESTHHPTLTSDGAAEAFVADADLTRYDLPQFQSMRFEIAQKEATLNMRLPVPLLTAAPARAPQSG